MNNFKKIIKEALEKIIIYGSCLAIFVRVFLFLVGIDL